MTKPSIQIITIVDYNVFLILSRGPILTEGVLILGLILKSIFLFRVIFITIIRPPERGHGKEWHFPNPDEPEPKI